MAIIVPLKSVFDNKGVSDASSSLKNFAKLAAASLSVAAVGDFLGESAKAAVEDRKSQVLLANQLKNTTGASKSQIAAVEKHIGALEQLSGVADDNIRPAFAQLTRSTGSVTQATKLSGLAMNIAAGTGKNVSTVAMALGKAYNGNTTALKKLGVPMSDSMKNAQTYSKGLQDVAKYTAIAARTTGKDHAAALKKLSEKQTEVNNAAKAGIDWQKDLAKSFDGAAKKAADADPYAKLALAMDNIKEAVGSALLPILDKLAGWLTSVVPTIQNFFSQLNDPTTQVGATWQVLSDIISAVFGFIVDNLPAIGTFVGIILAVKGAVELWTIAQTLLDVVLNANPIGLIVIGIAALVAIIVTIATKTHWFQDIWQGLVNIWNAGVQGMVDGWNGFVGFFQQAINVVVDFVKQHWGLILSLFVGPLGLVIQWIVDNWGTISKVFQDSLTAVTGFFNTAWGSIKDGFKVIFDAIGGMFKGYVNYWLSIFESFINFFSDGINNAMGGLNDTLHGISVATAGVINVQVGRMAHVTLPRLANGGIVPATPGGRMVTVAEAGQAEAIIPLSQMKSMMQLPKSQATTNSVVNVTVNAGMGADGNSIAKELVTMLKKYERNNGAVWVAA